MSATSPEASSSAEAAAESTRIRGGRQQAEDLADQGVGRRSQGDRPAAGDGLASRAGQGGRRAAFDALAGELQRDGAGEGPRRQAETHFRDRRDPIYDLACRAQDNRCAVQPADPPDGVGVHRRGRKGVCALRRQATTPPCAKQATTRWTTSRGSSAPSKSILSAAALASVMVAAPSRPPPGRRDAGLRRLPRHTLGPPA